MSRTNVHKSTWSATLVGEPSTIAPAESRVTELSLVAKRTLICAVVPVSCSADDLGGVDRNHRRGRRLAGDSPRADGGVEIGEGLGRD